MHSGVGMVRGIDPRQIRADDLRYLAAVAETGRLVTAARMLGVDHTTVSRRLRALEKSLGTRLLGRGYDGWVLTEDGLSVVEHARAVQEAVEKAADAIGGRAENDITGTVRVTAADGFGTRFVTPAITRVRSRYPGITVELLTGASRLNLRQTNFDIAVTIGPVPATPLYTESLCSYDSALFASREYLALHGSPASVEELARHPLIFFIDALQQVRELDLETYVSDPVVGFTSNNIFALLEATRRGGGIALISKFMAMTAPDLCRVDIGIPPARVEVTLAVRKEAESRGAVQAVRRALHHEVSARAEELVWDA